MPRIPRLTAQTQIRLPDDQHFIENRKGKLFEILDHSLYCKIIACTIVDYHCNTILELLSETYVYACLKKNMIELRLYFQYVSIPGLNCTDRKKSEHCQLDFNFQFLTIGL